MKVDVHVPVRGEVALDALLEDLTRAPQGEPFGDDALAFGDQLSQALLAHPDARSHPEVVALGFWLRRAELARLRADFEAGTDRSVVCVPRGLVFHVPPANVDTLFVYSWVLSVLVGNANLVRLPSVTTESIDLSCTAIDATLARAEFDELRARTSMVRYGHAWEITQAISRRADARILWGGDATITTLRQAQLPVHAKELTFHDRYSMTLLSARAVLALDDTGLENLARRFQNDLFWFDQGGCASPRLLVWCGDRAECDAASSRLLPMVAAGDAYVPETGLVLAKEAYAYRAALDRPVVDHRRFGNALTVMRLSSLEGFDRDHCGAGLLFEYFAGGVEALRDFVTRKDQTLTAFGFDDATLRDWVKSTRGRGIDRIVPVGQALAFHRFWDGYDLLRELVRHVRVETDGGGPR